MFANLVARRRSCFQGQTLQRGLILALTLHGHRGALSAWQGPVTWFVFNRAVGARPAPSPQTALLSLGLVPTKPAPGGLARPQG